MQPVDDEDLLCYSQNMLELCKKMHPTAIGTDNVSDFALFCRSVFALNLEG